MSNEKHEEKSARHQQIDARKKRMAEISAQARIPRVRVIPANDDLRRLLKHPNGVGFRPEGSVEWPLDQFTRRRIKEGAVTVEERAREPAPERRDTRRGTAAAPEQAP